jgi:hypothetical protein
VNTRELKNALDREQLNSLLSYLHEEARRWWNLAEAVDGQGLDGIPYRAAGNALLFTAIDLETGCTSELKLAEAAMLKERLARRLDRTARPSDGPAHPLPQTGRQGLQQP